MPPINKNFRRTANTVANILKAVGGQSSEDPAVEDEDMARDLIRSIKKLNIAVDRLSEVVEYQNRLLEED